MARLGFFSIGALLLSALSVVVAWTGNRFAAAFEIAFPAAAARDRLPITPAQSEAVIYTTGRSRVRAFAARVAQRHDERAGFGALGLPAAA